MATKNAMKPSVAYLEPIATIDPQDIVYADEADMDSRDDYAYGWNETGKRFHALKSGRRQGRVNRIGCLL
jgi:hypothetical protein